jgi:hypothetical protein
LASLKLAKPTSSLLSWLFAAGSAGRLIPNCFVWNGEHGCGSRLACHGRADPDAAAPASPIGWLYAIAGLAGPAGMVATVAFGVGLALHWGSLPAAAVCVLLRFCPTFRSEQSGTGATF